MPAFKVVLLRSWFGEELEQKLGEYDHFPKPSELLTLARSQQLGEGATLHVRPLKGKGPRRGYRLRELMESPTEAGSFTEL